MHQTTACQPSVSLQTADSKLSVWKNPCYKMSGVSTHFYSMGFSLLEMSIVEFQSE